MPSIVMVGDAPRRTTTTVPSARQPLCSLLPHPCQAGHAGARLGDLRQGTVTLPILLFLEEHPQADLLRSIFEQQDGREERIRALVDMVRSSPAIAAAREEAQRFTVESKQAIKDLSPNPYRQVMLDLADFLLERRR